MVIPSVTGCCNLPISADRPPEFCAIRRQKENGLDQARRKQLAQGGEGLGKNPEHEEDGKIKTMRLFCFCYLRSFAVFYFP